MAKKINMIIEVKNIILDLKHLGKTSGQLNKTLNEVYGYSVTRYGVYKLIRRFYSGCKEETDSMEIYRRPQKSVELVDVTEQ